MDYKLYSSIHHIDETRITVSLGTACNFHCSYCIQHGKRPVSLEKNRLVEVLAQITNELKKNGRKISFSFLGGEPTLFDLPFIFNCVKAFNPIKVVIVTNLTASAEYYGNLSDILGKIQLQICASYHEEEYDLDDFIQRIREIESLNKNIRIRASFVVTDNNKDIGKEFANRCLDENILYTISACRKPNAEPDVSEESMRNIKFEPDMFSAFCIGEDNKKYPKSDFLLNVDSVKGWLCTVNQNNIRIVSNGQVVCAAGCDPNIKLLGNIYDENFVYKYNPDIVVCQKDSRCSLCGQMVIAKNQDILNEFLKK